MLVIHRDGQLRVEIPKDVEDEGPDAIEAFVTQYHAAHPEAILDASLPPLIGGTEATVGELPKRSRRSSP